MYPTLHPCKPIDSAGYGHLDSVEQDGGTVDGGMDFVLTHFVCLFAFLCTCTNYYSMA